MILCELNEGILKEGVTAVAHKDKNDNLFYNIKHGEIGGVLWQYSIGVSKEIALPITHEDTIELNSNNFIVLPIYKNKNKVKDNLGNDLYYVTADIANAGKDGKLVLWSIPNKNLVDVSFKVSGGANVLGNGFTGSSRSSDDKKVPSPVVEILGHSVLQWQGYEPVTETWIGGVTKFIDDVVSHSKYLNTAKLF